ncbi:protein serine/threonine phosphatase 2C [Schizophyllum commune H4-8]|uniref:protein serine/threonine phosphatase 2C n=1 Tax=Schizophyllum commune (strain H4-8 / FGSC 9210) TaxID=578458 RepID=UPI002160B4FC|nr:protein serine/threonine phosphatase 2C [Schizophyllum commune H4-8]KAI5889502.1 protein serine/threonine phosphatase 2C [Schizophyllum commune H4-8]
MTPSKKKADLFRPDDDEGSFYTYTALTGAALDIAFHTSLNAFGSLDQTDYASFQPCFEKSQDRVVVEDIEIGGQVWRLRCIFDGHAGHAAVDYIQQAIVPTLHTRLAALDASSPPTDATIDTALSSALLAIDDAIGNEARALFPPDLDALSDAQIRAIADDHKDGGSGANHEKLLRAKSGSTALVALVDPPGERLWVASLGDCTAALCTRQERGGPWTVERLSANHNGIEPDEAARVRAEHPGEEGAMLNDRRYIVYSLLNSLGDFFCKFPPDFVRRVLVASDPNLKFSATKVDDFLARLLTPPYVSAQPEVRCVRIGSAGDATSSPPAEQLLVMFSDGLPECVLDDFSTAEPYFQVLPRILDRALRSTAEAGFNAEACLNAEGPRSNNEGANGQPTIPRPDAKRNLAAAIIRETLAGGEDWLPVMQAMKYGEVVPKLGKERKLDHVERDDRLSQLLTVEMRGKWMDDVTAVVHRIV